MVRLAQPTISPASSERRRPGGVTGGASVALASLPLATRGGRTGAWRTGGTAASGELAGWSNAAVPVTRAGATGGLGATALLSTVGSGTRGAGGALVNATRTWAGAEGGVLNGTWMLRHCPNISSGTLGTVTTAIARHDAATTSDMLRACATASCISITFATKCAGAMVERDRDSDATAGGDLGGRGRGRGHSGGGMGG